MYVFNKQFTETRDLGTKNDCSYSCVLEISSYGCEPETYTSSLNITVKIYETYNGQTNLYDDGYSDITITIQDQEVNQNTIPGLVSGHFTIQHSKLDGQGILQIGLEIRSAVSKNLNVSVPLNEVPRPASLAVDTIMHFINESFNLRLSHRNVGNLANGLSLYYDYYLSYSINNSQYVDWIHYTPTEQSTNSSISVIIPESACSFLPNTTSGSITIKCSTFTKHALGDYSWFLGDTFITFPIYVLENVKPTITNLIVEPYCIDPDMIVNEGQYIKDLHRANVKIIVNKSYNASLKSYKITGIINGVTKTLVSGIIENEAQEIDLINRGVLTPIFTESGDVTISATVTDSRGHTSNAVSVDIYVSGITTPINGSFDAFRCDTSGAPNENGNCIMCECNAAITENYALMDLSGAINLYRRNSDSTFTLVETKPFSITSYIINTSVMFTNTDNSLDYKAELTIEYYFTILKTSKLIPSIGAIIDIAPNGSVAIGKVSNTDNLSELKFEVNMMQINYNNIIPNETAKWSLGTDNNRWQAIYTTGSPISGSDARFKENINYVSSSNKARTSGQISQEDLHSFYKSDYLLTTYNYIGQEQQEYGFITQDMYGNSVGESLIIRNEHGDMFSINSYVSSIAGALQYEINLRDEQIAALQQEIQNLKDKIGL